MRLLTVAVVLAMLTLPAVTCSAVSAPSPPAFKVTRENFVELGVHSSGMLGSSDITWSGGSVSATETRRIDETHSISAKINAAQWARLLKLINAAGFPSLKSNYRDRRLIDGGISEVKLSVRSPDGSQQAFTVLNYGNVSPQRFRDLLYYCWDERDRLLSRVPFQKNRIR